MTFRSQVEDNVAHWILLLAFTISIGFSLFAFSKIASLEIVSADYESLTSHTH